MAALLNYRLQMQVQQLSDALRKLRDKSMNQQEAYENLKSDTDMELNELRSKAIKVGELEVKCRLQMYI